jgi:uncharacterized protein DUF3516
LTRVEGQVLRYLTDAYKGLVQVVPEDAKTEEILDLTEWLGELVRQVDSSLLDEWEQLRNPDPAVPVVERPPPPVTANRRAFRVMVRNALFRRVELIARRDWSTLGALDAGAGWDAGRWAEALAPFFEQHSSVLTGAAARGPGLFQIEEGDQRWELRQVLDDPEGDRDWAIVAAVDLGASEEAGEAVISVEAVRPV